MLRLSLLLLLSSCTLYKQYFDKPACVSEVDDEKHIPVPLNENQKSLKKAFAVQALSFTQCYENYLKFEDYKEDLKVCVMMKVRKNGRPRSVNVTNISSKVPLPLKMCLEQQIWKMNFAHVNLTSTTEYQRVVQFLYSPK